MKWLIQGYEVNGRARIKIGFPVSLLLSSEFFLLPSNKFIPKIVFDTQLAFPDKASVGKVGVRPGFFCTAGSPYRWADLLTSISFLPLAFPELSASDDSSLSDGLLLEEGETGTVGTMVRAGFWQDCGALAEFIGGHFTWGWSLE